MMTGILRFRFALLLSCWFTISIFCLAQDMPPKPTLLSAGALQQDVTVLRSAFEKLHPGLLRYQTQEQSEEAFNRLARDLNRDMSLREAYLRLSSFTATLRCGHTYPSFFNQSDTVTHELFDQSDRLPFFFRWLNRKMVVIGDFTSRHRLPPGTTVLSINGIPAGTILKKLMPHARADGHNDAKRIDYLQVVGADSYEAADLLAPMIFQNWHGPFRLVVQRPGSSKTLPITVPAVSASERRREALQTHPDPSGDDALFSLRFLGDDTAVLTMPTWVVYKTKWDWSAWLNNALDQIVDRRAPTLIIDLRGNEGGNDVGDLILNRLRDSSSPPPSAYARLVRYRTVPESFRPWLRTYDKRARDWGPAALELDKPWPTAPPVHYFRLHEEPDQPSSTTAPITKPYKGKVLVLVDSAVSSATFNFSHTIQTEHLGMLVGEPTGGNKRGINGGSFFFLRLPNSGIEIDIPLIGTFPSREERDEGLTPDFVVNISPEDIARRTDKVFDRARRISDQLK